MSFAVSEFGEFILTKDGLKPTAEVFSGKKLIAIYFSAHWCPPCRGFTPSLVEFYNNAKALGSDEIEMVFVSSDQDQHAFDEYWGSMPFLAVPYEKRDIKAKLGDKYGVRGIPSLIVLDSDGNVKDAAARGTVMQKGDDIKGALAAWA